VVLERVVVKERELVALVAAAHTPPTLRVLLEQQIKVIEAVTTTLAETLVLVVALEGKGRILLVLAALGFHHQLLAPPLLVQSEVVLSAATKCKTLEVVVLVAEASEQVVQFQETE
jgi:hypothetical protein